MRRLNNPERGASAVLVAILMVTLLGFSALAIDLNALWWDKQELQNGADASALAIATDCAHGACSTATNQVTAGRLTKGNKQDANATVDRIDLTEAHRVTVTVASLRDHWLAPVLGIDASTVQAAASAVWGGIGGATTLPLILSQCEFERTVLDSPTGIVRVSGKTLDDTTGCRLGQTPHFVPGGFGWLTTDGSGVCKASLSVDDWANSSTGNTTPKGCPDDLLKKTLAPGNEVLVPLFDEARGTGAGATYHVAGYAALKITAFCLTNSVASPDTKCTGSERWLEGRFVTYVATDAVRGDVPDHFGTVTISLDR
ncbi:hypothetical protein BW730_05625 [Tessaracoccus aquimaris]|uniref:Putative Flp pilus-assembly TadG-like N-terminal domain-containing protein n=1 Tax=Tessaracoccus aquimaris TaxID=1332264 RepID=A0A1Q2CLS9_9ACTN|nr:Tad domain-containing protein [Tessaracoccus aquimaris]AQP47074.1 hypothetical protein BW730_05625 [Tessaracoccus aquimaris]